MAGGVCVVGGMCGEGMHGRGRACVAGEMATAAGGAHPTRIHSCSQINSKPWFCFVFFFFDRLRRMIRTRHRSGGSGSTRPLRGSTSVRTAGEGAPNPACCRNTSGRIRASGRTLASPADSLSKPRATCVRKPDSFIPDGTKTGTRTGANKLYQSVRKLSYCT